MTVNVKQIKIFDVYKPDFLFFISFADFRDR